MKRRQAAAWALAAALLVGVLWVGEALRDAAAVRTPVVAAAMPMAPVSGVPRAVAGAGVAPVVSAATGRPSDRVWDLCGIGRMPMTGSARAASEPQEALAELPAHLGREPQVQAVLRLLEALDAGPPRWRAAAVMLRGEDAAGRPQHVALPALAALADDPVVAMWALQRCDQQQGCADADVQRWLRMEPDNLAPWLELLQRQPQRREELVTSMAAQGRFFKRYETALSQVVLDAAPADLLPYLLPGLWIYAIGVEAALSMPPFNGLTQTCPESLKPGSEAAPACAAIARALIQRSDSAIGVHIGLRLAERSYLSKAEAAQQRAALNKLMTVDETLFDAQQPLSCAGVARLRGWVEQQARLGELDTFKARAAARAASAASAPR